MTNYARMSPVYFSQVHELREMDMATWELFEQGLFSVSKSDVPITAIGCDHAIEQENRALKVLGGIKGIANSDRGLEEYFLMAAELSNIIKDFCETFRTEDDQSRKTEEYYQLSGSKNARIEGNVEKLSSIFSTYNINFDLPDVVYNILAMKVVPEKEVNPFLQVEIIDQERYTLFVKEKLEGRGSIWDTLKKEKLPTFINNNITVKVKIDNKDVQV